MLYHPFYCEENVWHLARHPALGERARHAVFITNPARTCAMWHQRAARRPGSPLLWDYHVVLLVEDPWQIWDLDTTLGFPVPAGEYLERSFRRDLLEEFLPVFRVVEAGELARVFASDRAHMRGEQGRWDRPPPPWDPIGAPGVASNLMRFIDLEDPIAGAIRSLDELLRQVSGKRSPG